MECCIRVRGHLDPVWQGRLAGLRITHADGGVSILSGHLRDQAALHGVLLRLIDLGLPLLALETHDAGDPQAATAPGMGGH